MPSDATTDLHWELEDGLPVRVQAPDGTSLVRGGKVDGSWRLSLRLPDHREVTLVLDAADHPVLGRCDLVLGPDGQALAHGSAVDWRRPTQIPALDRPGSLPRGAGTALLDLLAWQALRAGTGPLRYHGPYPSEALWSTLAASFRVDDDAATARARFTADAQARSLAGTRTPVDVAFVPEPHVWTWPDPRVCVQRRRGIERIYVDGHAFDSDGSGPRQLYADGPELVAGIVLGRERWAQVLRLDAQGRPRGEPRSLPSAPADLVGTALPAAVVDVLAQVLVAQAPDLLQPAMRERLQGTWLVWGEPGPDELVGHRDGVLELHAGLVAALPTEPAALLGVLVQLLQPTARRIAAAALAVAWDARAPDVMRH